MGITKIEAREERYCDRCSADLTGHKDPDMQTFTKITESVTHWKWSVISRRTDGYPTVMTSRIDLCGECFDAWGLFLQGRAVGATSRGAQIDARVAEAEARKAARADANRVQ